MQREQRAKEIRLIRLSIRYIHKPLSVDSLPLFMLKFFLEKHTKEIEIKGKKKRARGNLELQLGR